MNSNPEREITCRSCWQASAIGWTPMCEFTSKFLSESNDRNTGCSCSKLQQFSPCTSETIKMLLNNSSLFRNRSPRKYRGNLSSAHSFSFSKMISTNLSVLCIKLQILVLYEFFIQTPDLSIARQSVKLFF